MPLPAAALLPLVLQCSTGCEAGGGLVSGAARNSQAPLPLSVPHLLHIRRVARWTLFFGNDRLLRSGYHDKRIDRGPDIAMARSRLDIGAVDLHLLRPPYAPDIWGFYRDELIPHFIPKDHVAAVTAEMDDFVRKFTAAFAGPDGLIVSGQGPDGAKMSSPVYSPPSQGP